MANHLMFVIQFSLLIMLAESLYGIDFFGFTYRFVAFKMYTASQKIQKDKGADLTELEEMVSQVFIEIDVN